MKMKSKEIYMCQVQISDRGVTYPLQNAIEVHPPIELNVQRFLKKNCRAMDLSKYFQFEIINKKLIGYGTI